MARQLFLRAIVTLSIGVCALSPGDHVQEVLALPNFCTQLKSYTAIGDSYAGGFDSKSKLTDCKEGEKTTTDTCSKHGCDKDTGSYAYLFAHEFTNIKHFQYLPCTGAGTDDVRQSQVEHRDPSDHSADFGEGDSQPKLVTVSVGGDDGRFGHGGLFGNVVYNCIYVYSSQACDQAIRDAEQEINSEPPRLKALMDSILDRTNPDTRVVVFSYAKFWKNTNSVTCNNHPFFNKPTPGQRQEMNRLAILLNKHVAAATNSAGFIWANIDESFEGHRFCDQANIKSPDLWFQFALPSPLHPTLKGQNAYLQLLKQKLGCE